MSRHDFENGPVRVSIGWDAPLASFFLQIWTGEEKVEDEGPSIWLGAYYGDAEGPGAQVPGFFPYLARRDGRGRRPPSLKRRKTLSSTTLQGDNRPCPASRMHGA
jgi:hypothetical protein